MPGPGLKLGPDVGEVDQVAARDHAHANFGAAEVDAVGLEVGERLERLDAEVLAEAGHLVALVRHVDRQVVRAVRPDDARVDLLGDPEGAPEVGRPDRRGEAVHDVVGDADRLVLVVERQHRQDRPEDLLLGDAHVGRDVDEDRRLDVVAAGDRDLTAGRHRAPGARRRACPPRCSR